MQRISKKHYFVVAHTYHIALLEIKAKFNVISRDAITYVDSCEKLRGLRDKVLYLCRDWHLTPDVDDIITVATLHGFKIVELNKSNRVD